MPPKLSIVVPVYNEALFVPEALPRLIAAVENAGVSYEIHIVENGSTDGTADIVKQHANDHVKVSSFPGIIATITQPSTQPRGNSRHAAPAG